MKNGHVSFKSGHIIYKVKIMWLWFNLDENVSTTIIRWYDSHGERSKKNEKNEFYACLDDNVQRVSERDLLMVIGDFNARVGYDFRTLE